MNIDYAKAYGNERMAHAQIRRRQREAVLADRTARNVSRRRIRGAVGNVLILLGERLSGTHPPQAPAVGDMAHT